MNVTIYSRPGCGACEQTRKVLDRLHVPYTEFDIDDDGVEPPEVDGIGLPIVVVDRGNHYESWTGFRYDKIKTLPSNVRP